IVSHTLYQICHRYLLLSLPVVSKHLTLLTNSLPVHSLAYQFYPLSCVLVQIKERTMFYTIIQYILNRLAKFTGM
ncbi:hypothetical protein BDW59DRAFT_155319, partial [Aspergillus cavernicola]